MKFSPLFLTVGSVAVLALVASSPALAKGENLLPEGSFEILERGQPEGWKMPDPNWYKNFGGKAAIKSEKGDRYLFLSVPITKYLFGATVSVAIPEDARRLRLSYRMRAKIDELAPNDGSGVGATVIRWWGDVEIGNAKFAGAEWVQKSTKDWQNFEVDLDVPKGITTLSLTAGLKNTAGEVEVDDVSVEVLR